MPASKLDVNTEPSQQKTIHNKSDNAPRADPELEALSAFLSDKFQGDFNALLQFAAEMSKAVDELTEENELLVAKLIDINGFKRAFEHVATTDKQMAINMMNLAKDLDFGNARALDSAVKISKSATASRNAHLGHKEDRAMKADVFEWLNANFSKFKSADAAAEAIQGKVANITFRTAGGWIKQWKKQRPASKP